MRIFKLSLGAEQFTSDEVEVLKRESLVCVHPNTDPMAQSSISQGKLFLEAEKGDLFFACRANNSILVLGMFLDKRPMVSILPGKPDWTDREYEIVAEVVDGNNYNHNFKKWWTPAFRSTFVEVPKNEYQLFEKEILKPVFDKSLSQIEEARKKALQDVTNNLGDYIALQKLFQRYEYDQDFLFDSLNGLGQKERQKLLYEYRNKSGTNEQPVVQLRMRIVEELAAGAEISHSLIESFKVEIDKRFEKNVFHVWKNPFRVLYPLFYSRYKSDLVRYFDSLLSEIQSRLDITSVTSQKVVHFDGANNLGSSRMWFAIYNNSYPKQTYAKQLFLEIQDGVRFGLLDRQNEANNQLQNADNVELETLVQTYRRFKQEILNDNSMENARYAELRELLEQKGQLILEGAPGTGKTRFAKDLSESILFGSVTEEKDDQAIRLKGSANFAIVQFHPSYTYEDFVRGIETSTNEKNQVEYLVRNKVLGEMAAKAFHAKHIHHENLAQAYKEYLEDQLAIKKRAGDYYYFGRAKDVRLKDITQSQSEKRYKDQVGFLRFEVQNLEKGSWYMPEWVPMETHFNHEEAKRSELPSGRGYTAVMNDFLAFTRKPPEYVLIIDEINRANLPAVLGELIYAFEYRDEPVQSMYGIKKNEGVEDDNGNFNREIILPNNLYIIGTMNTADRSVGHIDYAIRRRFGFVEMLPKNLEELGDAFRAEAFKKVSELFVKEVKESSIELKASDHLSEEFSDRPQDVWIGHSYFIASEEDFKIKLKYEVVPILEEYIKDGILKSSAKEVIKQLLEMYG